MEQPNVLIHLLRVHRNIFANAFHDRRSCHRHTADAQIACDLNVGLLLLTSSRQAIYTSTIETNTICISLTNTRLSYVNECSYNQCIQCRRFLFLTYSFVIYMSAMFCCIASIFASIRRIPNLKCSCTWRILLFCPVCDVNMWKLLTTCICNNACINHRIYFNVCFAETIFLQAVITYLKITRKKFKILNSVWTSDCLSRARGVSTRLKQNPRS
jgi:hypothetical protein